MQTIAMGTQLLALGFHPALLRPFLPLKLSGSSTNFVNWSFKTSGKGPDQLAIDISIRYRL